MGPPAAAKELSKAKQEVVRKGALVSIQNIVDKQAERTVIDAEDAEFVEQSEEE